MSDLGAIHGRKFTPKENSGINRVVEPWSALRTYLNDRGVRDEYFIATLAAIALVISLGIFFLQDSLFDAISLNSLGYLGIFLITFLGSATIFLPSGGGAAVILAGAVLNPFLVGLIAGSGTTLGELTGYAIGYQGGAVLEKWPGGFAKAKRWMERRGSITIFILAISPNPIFDAAGLAAGAIRFPLRQFLALVWVGKTIQGTCGALIGAVGSGWLTSLAESLLD